MQGSSASQMTAAKVLDVIARRLGSAGQASDAVSAYIQVKMEDASTLLTLPMSECPDIWIRLPRHKLQKNIAEYRIKTVVPLGRKEFVRTPLCWSAVGETIRKRSCLETGWWKALAWECLFGHRQQSLFSIRARGRHQDDREKAQSGTNGKDW